MQRDRLRGMVTGDLDWTAIAQMALAHNVSCLLHRGLIASCSELLPRNLANALATHRAEERHRNQRFGVELERIIGVLEDAGVQTLPFKGPTLAKRLYGDPSLRSFGDLDILIRRHDADICRETLRSLGYTDGERGIAYSQIKAFERCAGQDRLFSKRANIAIEPHWALFPNTFAFSLDYDGLWNRSELVELESENVRCLSAEDQLLVVCLHGAKEQWWRLNWVCDVAESVVSEGSSIRWPILISRAEAQKCLRALLVGLCLANRLLGVSLPVEVLQAILSDRAVARLTNMVISQKLSAFDPKLPGSLSKLSRFRLGIHEGVRRKTLYILRTLFAPRPAHIRMLTLPTQAYFIYYPLRAIHDYVLLPCWRLWKWAGWHRRIRG